MITIIIPVKNDRRIQKLLSKLSKISSPEKIEILVIDASGGILDDIKESFPAVKWINFKNETNKKYTFTEQINLGLKVAKGDLIAFIDADCSPDKNWLIQLTKPIFTEGESYVTGKVVSLDKSFYDQVWENLEHVVYREESGSANTVFKKEVLSKVGYFDERFEAGSDIDFSWRVREAGYKIRYNKEAIIFDHWGDFRQDFKRAIRYGKSKIQLYRKHPNKFSCLLSFKRDLFTIYAIVFFLYIVFMPVFYIFWKYYPLLLLFPIARSIKFNPIKKLPYDFFWGYGAIKEVLFPSPSN